LYSPRRSSGAAAQSAVHPHSPAHGLAVHEIRRAATNAPDVSVTLNFHVARGEREAAQRVEALANRAFTSPMLLGRYDDDLLEFTKSVTDWSFVRPGDLEQIQQPIDVLGVNYYSTVTVRMWDGAGEEARNDGHKDVGGSPWPGLDDVECLPQDGPYTDMGWNIAPDGLEDLLLSLKDQFPEQPLMITENGAAFPDVVTQDDDGQHVHDELRIDYLSRHFGAAKRAMDQGVDLRGYLVWSLMDNFEWGYGFSKRFGIVRVNYETGERLPKDSAFWVRDQIQRKNG